VLSTVAIVHVNDHFADVRTTLIGRAQSCWERLEDAVSELCAVHGADDAEIVERVRIVIADEDDQRD
jgi:hypothetical protein